MTKILLAGMGGFLGSAARFLISGLVQRLPVAQATSIPLGTLAVNVLGCFLIGLINGLADARGVFSGETRVFLLIGVVGGFTTFSTFGYESFQMMRDELWLPMLGNVAVQSVCGVAAVWAGTALSKML